MHEVAESIDRTIEAHRTAEQPHTELDDAAVKWATHSLRTYYGELLTKALAMSKAMVEFTAEFLQKER